MRKFFAVMATLLMVVVVVQFFLAAGGAFDSAPKEESFQPHRAVGSAILLLAVLVTVVAALARMPGRVIGLSGLVAGLAVLQFVIAAIARAFGDTGSTSTAGELVFGLHAVNGLAIMAVAGMIARQARQPSGTAEPARQAS
jgi:cytochrome b561